MLEKDVLRGIHVLIAEDNDDTRELLEIVLRHAAARVTSTADGGAALQAIRRLLPDILVADLAMPSKDGYWLIEQVRALPPHAGGRIPAVAVSALVAPPDIEHAKALGYTEHVAKPADPGQLATLIARLVGRDRRSRS
ncbi:MAG TPA: response regulator [Vicinamibacteria bacterium]